jgi:sugar phosphate isomerase/epimerase
MSALESAAFRIGLCSVTFRSLSPTDVVLAAADAGIHGIEWGADVHVPPGRTEVARDVAARCKESGIACPSYGSYLSAGRSTIDEATLVLDTALVLGARNVRVWCPFGSPPGSDDGLFGRAAGSLDEWSALAAARDLTVSVEYHVDTFTETAASAKRLLDVAGRPSNLFTYWQPVTGRALPAEAATMHPDVSHVHVFHWRTGGERRPLDEGGKTWPLLLATLGRPNRWTGERYAFLEFVRGDDPLQLVADAATLRSWTT